MNGDSYLLNAKLIKLVLEIIFFRKKLFTNLSSIGTVLAFAVKENFCY